MYMYSDWTIQNRKNPRHRALFRVRFDRTNLIFKRKKPADVLDNEATFIGQDQQCATYIRIEDLLGLIFNFTKRYSDKIR